MTNDYRFRGLSQESCLKLIHNATRDGSKTLEQQKQIDLYVLGGLLQKSAENTIRRYEPSFRFDHFDSIVFQHGLGIAANTDMTTPAWGRFLRINFADWQTEARKKVEAAVVWRFEQMMQEFKMRPAERNERQRYVTFEDGLHCRFAQYQCEGTLEDCINAATQWLVKVQTTFLGNTQIIWRRPMTFWEPCGGTRNYIVNWRVGVATNMITSLPYESHIEGGHIVEDSYDGTLDTFVPDTAPQDKWAGVGRKGT